MPYKDVEKQREANRKSYSKNKEKQRERSRIKYLNNREKCLARSKKNYVLNKENVLKNSRKTHLRSNYHLSVEEYQQMVEVQNNVCAICNFPETRKVKNGTVKPLSIDHCHTTGKVRKLLCNDCNSAIGFAQENTEILQKMINYLNEFRE